MYDVVVIGAGISGASFAYKTSKFAETLIIEAQDYNKQIPIRTNIFAEHNKPYIEDQFWNDESIFPRSFLQLNYKSEKYDGILDSQEFGSPMGKISHTEIFLQKLIKNFENQGGFAHFNEKVRQVNKHKDYIEVINDKNETFKTKLLVLATGSRGFDLQKSLGFEVPDSFMGIYTNIYANETLLDENFPFQYMFHLNPNISPNGPFFFNVGKSRISTGYLGNRESHSELTNKLDRILQNYQKIQGFMKGLTWDKKEFISGAISKHPIKSFTSDRIILLGEAAGLVTSYFYEGILCGLVCADVASETIKPILESNNEFKKRELVKYDQEIARVLLNGYFKNGDACEYLFYSGGSYVKSLWSIYTNLLLTNKTVRKYVYEAHTIQDLSKYDTNKDRYVGESLFSALPTLSKITLGPRFFRAMLK